MKCCFKARCLRCLGQNVSITEDCACGLQWAHGFDIKFGLYAWEPGMGRRREIRAATTLLADIYKELPAQVKFTLYGIFLVELADCTVLNLVPHVGVWPCVSTCQFCSIAGDEKALYIY